MTTPCNPDPKLPGTTDLLVESLDKLFPSRCPSPEQSERDIWIYAGKRALVEYIQVQHRINQNAVRQTEAALTLHDLIPQH